LTALATVASAQPRVSITSPPPAPPVPQPKIPLPLSPGVMPGSPWGPGAPFAPDRPPPPPPPRRRAPREVVFPAFDFACVADCSFYDCCRPFASRYSVGSGYDWSIRAPIAVAVPITLTPQYEDPPPILANEFPATLSLQFPAAADVWLSGKKA